MPTGVNNVWILDEGDKLIYHHPEEFKEFISNVGKILIFTAQASSGSEIENLILNHFKIKTFKYECIDAVGVK